jgi:hypothetical protein
MAINIMDPQNTNQRDRNDSKQNKKKTTSPKNNEIKFNKNNQKQVTTINNSVTNDFSKTKKNFEIESLLINNDNSNRNYQFQNTLLNSTNNTNFKSTTNKTSNSNFFSIKSPKGNPTPINLSSKNQNNLININIKTNQINKPDLFLEEKQENYNELKNSLLASMPIISLTSPKGNKSSRSPLRKNFVKSTSKTKHPIIKIEEDNILSNSVEENFYTKRNASERNLKSANPNCTNNNLVSGKYLMNQSVKNSTFNSTNQNLNSTQQGSIVLIFILNF